jgi:hemerythrin-like metal-binding protein
VTAGESPAGAPGAPAQETLENEHAVQLRLVDAFRTAAGGGEGRDVAAGILRHLVDYTLMHFLSEQLLMRLHAYPAYEAHLQAHEHLMDEVRELERRFVAGDVPSSLAAAEALHGWMQEHLSGPDRALAGFLSRGGRD